MSDQIEREQQIEEESLTKNSLQIQKAAWIREELEKRRAQEDQLLQQILREQQMLQELDEDMDQNMAHAKEGRRYREDIKARVDDRVYEMHDLSADKREGMREYGYAYRRGYALAMVFFSLALCVFAGYLHGIASQTCLVLMFFTGVQAAILVHKKQCPKFWQFVCDVFSALIFPGMLILFIGCELHYSYYERALPYCLAVGLFLLALTTASYFLYDPYRSARRRVGDAKSMIRSIERSAKKQVKKNQKQQAKEELRQDRLQKKESEKLLKIQQKQEVRLEKRGKRLQKWENNKTLVLLNEQTTSLVTLNTINPEHIKNFKIEKGKFNFEGKEYDAKIIVKTKKEFNSNFITIDELISKYTNLKKEDKFIYSINGEVANATEKNILVDEKYIMQIKVVKLDKIEENLNFIKILTRSKQNLNNANEIIIRGNEISMNE